MVITVGWLTLFIAINKRTCDLYIERIGYNASYARDLLRSYQQVILAYEPTERGYEKTDYQCGPKMCKYSEICWHEGEGIEMNCRTCEYSDLEDDGMWSCDKHGTGISTEKQERNRSIDVK